MNSNFHELFNIKQALKILESIEKCVILFEFHEIVVRNRLDFPTSSLFKVFFLFLWHKVRVLGPEVMQSQNLQYIS